MMERKNPVYAETLCIAASKGSTIVASKGPTAYHGNVETASTFSGLKYHALMQIYHTFKVLWRMSGRNGT